MIGSIDKSFGNGVRFAISCKFKNGYFAEVRILWTESSATIRTTLYNPNKRLIKWDLFPESNRETVGQFVKTCLKNGFYDSDQVIKACKDFGFDFDICAVTD